MNSKARYQYPVGFTLIELLVVMSVILILAALVIAGANYAQYKSARSRAESELGSFALGCESFKLDNGDYPRATGSSVTNDSDLLNIAVDKPPKGAGTDKYSKASLVIYSNLSGDQLLNRRPGQTTDGVKNKVYIEFRPNQLFPNPSTTQSTVQIKALVDPWKNPYGYSTINLAETQEGRSPAPDGFNPTFDLWCTCNITGTVASNPPKSNDPSLQWVKNW